MTPVKNGVELAGDHGGHRLVEPRDPLADPADIDQQTPLRVDRHRRQVQVAELPADRRGAFGGLERRVEIAGRLRGEDPAHRHVAVSDVRRPVRDVPLRALEPPGRDRHVPARSVLEAEAHRDDRRPAVGRRRVAGVRALAEVERPLELTGPPALVGLPLQLSGVEIVRSVGHADANATAPPCPLASEGRSRFTKATAGLTRPSIAD